MANPPPPPPQPVSSYNTPCAACKLLRRKCAPCCAFAPHFPVDQPHKFSYVHRVFGASNVSKILQDLPPHRRQEAANSLVYEAEQRLRDPVYSCIGNICLLHQHLERIRHQLSLAKAELCSYTSGGGGTTQQQWEVMEEGEVAGLMMMRGYGQFGGGFGGFQNQIQQQQQHYQQVQQQQQQQQQQQYQHLHQVQQHYQQVQQQQEQQQQQYQHFHQVQQQQPLH